MLSHFEKSKNKDPLRGIFLKIGLAAALIVILFLIIANVKVYKKRQEINLQLESLESRVTTLKAENSNLKEKTLTANDDEYIEKIAREELNFQKPGETVISFVGPEKTNQAGRAEDRGVFYLWLGWLSNLFK